MKSNALALAAWLLLAAGVGGCLLWILFDRLQRYRGKLAADARARELLETWDERDQEAKRVDAWSKPDTRHDARR